MMITFRDILTESFDRQKSEDLMVFSVTNEGIIPRELKYNEILSTDNSNNKIIKYGDIVFGNSRHTLNYGIINRDMVGSVSSAYKVFNINKKVILPEYLEYYLSANRKNMMHIIKPGARDNRSIDSEMLYSTELQIPEISQQRHNVELFSLIDRIINSQVKIVTMLEKMGLKIYEEWFIKFNIVETDDKTSNFVNQTLGEFDENQLPKDWILTNFSDWFTFVKGRKPLFTSRIDKSEYLRYLTLGVIKRQESLFASIDKCVIVNTCDALMVMDGGSSGSVYYGMKGILGSTFAHLKCKKANTKMFVLFTAKYYESHFQKHLTGSAIPHADKSYVGCLKLATNNQIIYKFEDLMKPIIEHIVQINNHVDYLLRIRDEFINKVFGVNNKK